MQMTDVTKKKIRGELLDELLTGVKTQEDMFGKGGLVSALTGQLIERMLSAELGLHLKDEAQRQEVSLQTGESTAFDEAEESLATKKNRRNGTSRKSLESSHGPVTIAVPRDRQSTFEPIIVPKHLRRIAGFDDKVLALYSRGLSTRDISETLQDLYGTEVSAELISQVTEAVHEELVAWQNRPLEASYAVIWMDAIFIKIRDQGVVQNQALHLAIGLTLDGKKHVIGFWLEATKRREILATRAWRMANAWPARCFDYVLRRTQRLAASDCHDVSAHHCARLHRPPSSALFVVCFMARSKSRGSRYAQHLLRADRRRRPSCARSVWRGMEPALSDDPRQLAAQLGNAAALL